MARVLIADDAPIMRKTLRALIELAGHQVVAEAEDGVGAALEYERVKPDLVTMDISMPKMDGIEAAARIIKSYPKARIIIISADQQEDKIKEAIKAGVVNFIIKPVTTGKIMSSFTKALQSTPPEKEPTQ